MVEAPGEPGDNYYDLQVPSRTGGALGDWRVERARLEHRHRQRLLKRKPRYLSYSQSSLAVQELGLSTKEEWFEWVELGERLSPYVPSDPESYYKKTGEWLGWSLWLTGSYRGMT